MIGFAVSEQSFMVKIVIFALHGDARNLLRHGPDRRNYQRRPQLVLRTGYGPFFRSFSPLKTALRLRQATAFDYQFVTVALIDGLTVLEGLPVAVDPVSPHG